MRWPKLSEGVLVLVRWHDAESAHGWIGPGEDLDDNEPVLSVGWVVEGSLKTQSGRELVICGDRSETDPQTNNRRIRVPHGMVLSLTEVGGKELYRKGGKRGSAPDAATKASQPISGQG